MRARWLGSVMMVCALATVGCAAGGSALSPARPDAPTDSEPPALNQQQLAKVVKLCSDASPSSESATACMLLGAMSSAGLAGKRNEAHADAMFERAVWIQMAACEQGDVDACYMLGSLRATKLISLDPDSAQAAQWAEATLPPLERACSGGEANACVLVGAIYEGGKGVARDIVAAARAYQRACSRGDEQSCAWGSDESVATATPAIADVDFGPF